MRHALYVAGALFNPVAERLGLPSMRFDGKDNAKQLLYKGGLIDR